MEAFWIRRSDLIIPGCGENLLLARGATLAVRSHRHPHPTSNKPMRLGFPHRAGKYRRGESRFSSLGCSSCIDMDVREIRGWDLIHIVSGASSTLARGATLPA